MCIQTTQAIRKLWVSRSQRDLTLLNTRIFLCQLCSAKQNNSHSRIIEQWQGAQLVLTTFFGIQIPKWKEKAATGNCATWRPREPQTLWWPCSANSASWDAGTPRRTYYIIIIFLLLLLAVCMAPGGHAHQTECLQPCWLLWPPTKANTQQRNRKFTTQRWNGNKCNLKKKEGVKINFKKIPSHHQKRYKTKSKWEQVHWTFLKLKRIFNSPLQPTLSAFVNQLREKEMIRIIVKEISWVGFGEKMISNEYLHKHL